MLGPGGAVRASLASTSVRIVAVGVDDLGVVLACPHDVAVHAVERAEADEVGDHVNVLSVDHEAANLVGHDFNVLSLNEEKVDGFVDADLDLGVVNGAMPLRMVTLSVKSSKVRPPYHSASLGGPASSAWGAGAASFEVLFGASLCWLLPFFLVRCGGGLFVSFGVGVGHGLVGDG